MPLGDEIAEGVTSIGPSRDWIREFIGSDVAAEYLRQYGERGLGEITGGLQRGRGLLSPYQQRGGQALNRLSQAVLEGDMSGFQEDPGFQYQMNRGMGAVESSGAARGSQLSGATMRELQGTGQQLANQQYNQYLNRLAGMAGMGQQAASQGAGMEMQGGLGRAGLQTQIGSGMAAAEMMPYLAGSQAAGVGSNVLGTFLGGLMCDRKLKKNVKKIGETDSGLNVYSFDYIWGAQGVGPMADEVKEVFPEAVFKVGEYDAVDMTKVA